MTAGVAYWCDELDHRAADLVAVRTAALFLVGGGTGSAAGRLTGVDPLRHRPLLDDDPDGAVLVDVLLAPLSAADYVGAAQRVHRGEPFWRDADPLAVVEHLLARGSVYATPECRVRLEGRARYNLAFDAAALRGTRAPS